jgi:hypothetical protein
MSEVKMIQPWRLYKTKIALHTQKKHSNKWVLFSIYNFKY